MAPSLPGDIHLVIQYGAPFLYGYPITVPVGKYEVTYSVRDSDDNLSDEDGDSMVLTIDVQAPPPLRLRDCPYERSRGTGQLNIDITYAGAFDDWLRDEVECAAAYWETAITADLGPAVDAEGYVGRCSTYGRLYRESEVDDLQIVVHFGGTRAAATTWTCEERAANGLPYTARIGFASNSERYDLPRAAAANPGSIGLTTFEEDLDFLYNLARHEIAHALGFGSSSAFRSLTADLIAGEELTDKRWPNVRLFLGAAALREYRESRMPSWLVGDPAKATVRGVPIDGPYHWAEWLASDVMYRSIYYYHTVTAVTLGAMEDIGHVVDYTMAGE